jgi:methionyl-tRNA formyltransferase
LKILKIKPFTSHSIPSYPPKSPNGTVFEYDKTVAIKCADGAVVLELIQPEGKKPMKGEDFLRGHREIIGQILS